MAREEERRLREAAQPDTPWKKWGPYLSERQWGTVREDYSETGDAWNYFSHDQARSRAYRWGEDGLAGIHLLGSENARTLLDRFDRPQPLPAVAARRAPARSRRAPRRKA